MSLFTFFRFYLLVSQNGKVHYSGRLTEIRLSACISFHYVETFNSKVIKGRPCTLGCWFFSCDLWSLYPLMHFLSMLIQKPFPPAVSSPLQFFTVFIISFLTSPDTLYILRQSHYPTLRDHIIYLFVVNLGHSLFFSSRLVLHKDVLINV